MQRETRWRSARRRLANRPKDFPAHKPWRNRDAEAQLNGAPATRETFARSADTLLRGARGFGHNDFKVELARRAIIRALTQAAQGTSQSQVDKRVSGSVS